ncbi:hypothetical protein [uncultured Methanosphaera sp.]|jgi:hypothetical protein|uniref:hypothetical protein n=1 Tax=uncultured Methanosphaera sp. TaxID=262501 RepID=UPI000DC3680C|nr:hypothetical protein [uncultured Methanosphaera sp.]MDD6285787.1 hypothetical protein [Methanobacteriaceae archaeon]RAP43514.1 MAG: hypothetical protein BZ134_06865 [Methanosphaera sp. SHI1033]
MITGINDYLSKFRYELIGDLALMSFIGGNIFWAKYVVNAYLAIMPNSLFTQISVLFVDIITIFIFFICYYFINMIHVFLEDCSFNWEILRDRYLFKDNIINILLSGLLGIVGLTGIGNLRNKLYKRTFLEVIMGILLLIVFLIKVLYYPIGDNLGIINPYNLVVTALLVFWWWECIMDTFLCTSNIKNNETVSIKGMKIFIIVYAILLVIFYIGYLHVFII